MKKGGGKNKGSGFEITVARILTKWVDPTATVDLFWRSASSGAQFSLAKRYGKDSNQPGDIKATDHSTMWVTDKFFIECKFYANINFWNLISGKNCSIRDWWVKCTHESAEAGKIPWLIFKSNGSSTYIMISDIFVSTMSYLVGDYNDCSHARCHFCNKEEFYNTTIFLLDDFLRKFPPEVLQG